MNKFVKAWDTLNDSPIDIRKLPKSRNGIKCDCNCVECQEPLEACQGDVRSWYFRHQSSSNCSGGPMTALHLMAQHLLVGNHIIKTKRGEVSYFNGVKEFSVPNSSYKADIGGKKEDKTIFIIEIFVNHQLTEKDDKFKFYNNNKIHSIEIDLSQTNPEIDNASLLQKLLKDTSIQNELYIPQEFITSNKASNSTFGEWALLVAGSFGVYKLLKWIYKNKK